MTLVSPVFQFDASLAFLWSSHCESFTFVPYPVSVLCHIVKMLQKGSISSLLPFALTFSIVPLSLQVLTQVLKTLFHWFGFHLQTLSKCFVCWFEDFRIETVKTVVSLSDLWQRSIESLQTVLFHFLPLVFFQGHRSTLIFLQRVIRIFWILSSLKLCSQVFLLLFYVILSPTGNLE